MISPLNLKAFLEYPIDHTIKIQHNILKSVHCFFTDISEIEHYHLLGKLFYLANIHYLLMNCLP